MRLENLNRFVPLRDIGVFQQIPKEFCERSDKTFSLSLHYIYTICDCSLQYRCLL